MLQATHWSYAVRLNWATPFKIYQIEYQKVIEPIFPIATAEDIHLVVDHTRCVKLPHGSLTSDDAGDVEGKFV